VWREPMMAMSRYSHGVTEVVPDGVGRVGQAIEQDTSSANQTG
jgi:hypothetical protein